MNGRATQTRHRVWPLLLGGGLLALIVGAASAWAITTVTAPAPDPLETESASYATAQLGEVSSSLTLGVTASWSIAPVGVNQAIGVVTSAPAESTMVADAGSTLYTVNLRPVVAAVGSVPSFRSIGEGVSGDDVAQLQRMLSALGHYRGAIDGKAESGTVLAIKRWQKALGVESTGATNAGDIIYLPELPTRIIIDKTKIAAGHTLQSAESVISVLPSSPQFVIQATENQAAQIPTGALVRITGPDNSTWEATTSEQKSDPATASFTIELTSTSEDEPICLEDCAKIPVDGKSNYPSTVLLVQPVSGVVVPVASLSSLPDGRIVVETDTGETVTVIVKQSAQGMAVVDGVQEGTRVKMMRSA
ncbi:peptidoglycan-binding domain-containing protein [Microbacterium sp. BH-3-3-3]|uniref:peptidoglycan-binding domain-containing protein n=1 Tax=Microbacterium sp. BH-3-3-3 TaxID=1906742 RepID=UPI0009F40C93|nr:peptidoglycan-binding domain-containing protein [Microbacterium sp. BH-3-3-3]